MGHTRRGLPSSFHCNSMYCYKHAEEEEEGEEKAAVRVKGERGRSRFTVTFSPILPKATATGCGGWFFFRSALYVPQWLSRIFGRIFFCRLGRTYSAKCLCCCAWHFFFFFFSFFCGNGSACGGGKTNKNGASEQEGLFLPLCLRPGNTARKNKKVANVPGVYFPVHFFRGKET